MTHGRGTILAMASFFICRAIGQLCGELELFNCPNNKCISEHLVCDGKSDCVDGGDEQEDLCLMIDTRNTKDLCNGVRHFSCLGNPCLPIYKACDDINDCLYGTDERPSVCGRRRERLVRSSSGDSSGSGHVPLQCSPKILQGIISTTAPRGANVTFSCVASIFAHARNSTFVWTTTAIGIVSLEGSDKQTDCQIYSTLVLNNISSNYSGQYNCTAVTGNGNYTSSGYLQVTDETSCVEPRITAHPANLSVFYGADAIFSCSICYVLGNINITWLPSSVKGTITATRMGRASVSSLRLSAIDTSYRGNYWCVAKYANTTVSSTPATLTVIVPPLIIQIVSSQTALEKSDAKLVCNASGAGVLTYSWRRLDTSSGSSTVVGTNSSIVTLRNLQLSDAGTYQCTVTDAAGQSATSDPATLQVSALHSGNPSFDAIPAVGTIAGGAVGGAASVVGAFCVVLLFVVALRRRSFKSTKSVSLINQPDPMGMDFNLNS